jgi:hypothetical protein
LFRYDDEPTNSEEVDCDETRIMNINITEGKRFMIEDEPTKSA